MEQRIPRSKFIRLGAAAGITTAGASVIVACGGGGESGDGGGGETTAGTSGGATGTGGSGAIAQASEVPTNSAQQFTNEGQPAVLVHLQNGDFVAYSAVCTHQQCTVAYQQDSSQLSCPCHGSIFDPSEGGAVVNGPAEEPLPEIPVQVQNGQVTRA